VDLWFGKLEQMRTSAPPWIADNGLRGSSDAISGIEPAGSTTVVVRFILAFLVLAASVSVGEAFPQEFKQFVFRNEFCLLSSIHFFHHAFQLAPLGDIPKLNYKCSSHDEFRLKLLAPHARRKFVELM
jgi:hypothetical protein